MRLGMLNAISAVAEKLSEPHHSAQSFDLFLLKLMLLSSNPSQAVKPSLAGRKGVKNATESKQPLHAMIRMLDERPHSPVEVAD